MQIHSPANFLPRRLKSTQQSIDVYTSTDFEGSAYASPPPMTSNGWFGKARWVTQVSNAASRRGQPGPDDGSRASGDRQDRRCGADDLQHLQKLPQRADADRDPQQSGGVGRLGRRKVPPSKCNGIWPFRSVVFPSGRRYCIDVYTEKRDSCRLQGLFFFGLRFKFRK
jgi:hypothetical protein